MHSRGVLYGLKTDKGGFILILDIDSALILIMFGEKHMKTLFALLLSSAVASSVLAETWTVDDDGKADFDNIQEAVDAASDGDEIIVMPGTYTSTENYGVAQTLWKDITLRSSDPNNPDVVAKTIIDGEGVRRGILVQGTWTSGPTIQGFTIINGNSLNEGGGGVRCSGVASITNCTFTGNTSETEGGGFFIYPDAPVTFTDCKFINNQALNYNGGGGVCFSDNAFFENCIFDSNSDNSGYGGGLYLENSGPTISNCLFANNANVGIGCRTSAGGFSQPQINNCEFYNNGAGLKALDYVQPTLDGCVLSNNGCGVSNYYSSTIVLNSVLCSNGNNFCGETWIDGGGNTIADICDDDDDGIPNDVDNCPLYNPNQADCNGNGIGDICDINDLYSLDINGNEIPDECECLADVNADGTVNLYDILTVIANWGSNSEIGDVNYDGLVNVSDLLIVIGNWGECE